MVSLYLQKIFVLWRQGGVFGSELVHAQCCGLGLWQRCGCGTPECQTRDGNREVSIIGRLNALKYTEHRRERKGQGLTWFLLSIRESWIKFELRTCWTVERVCLLVWCSVGNRTWYSCCSRCWCEEGELEVASCRMCCVQLHSFSSCPRRGSDSKFVSLSNAEWQVVWRVTVTSQNYFLRLYPFSSQGIIERDETPMEKEIALLHGGDFEFSHIFYFCRKGFEAIVEDEVTQRFSSEELLSWNLLTRTNVNFHYISLRLTVVWVIGVIVRYCFLLPLR